MNQSMIITQPGTVVFSESAMPVPAAGEVLLELLYGGICGSDLSTYRGAFAYVSYPRCPGHEFSARVVTLGPGVTGLEPGRVVTANPYFNCGECHSCRRGSVNACMTNQTMGVQREGAFSRFITLPAERIYDGKGIPARALALVEPFCISLHGVKRAQVQPGERVLVVGAGTIGILAMVTARQRGAQVFVADIAPDKLAFAEKFGAAGTLLNQSPEAFSRQVADLTGGAGFDVAIEAVGLPSTFQNCIDAAAFGARVVLIGVGKTNLDFNFTMIQKKELTVLGSRNALKADFMEAIDFIAGGGFPLESIISAVFPFEAAPEAFRTLDAQAGSLLKVVFEF